MNFLNLSDVQQKQFAVIAAGVEFTVSPQAVTALLDKKYVQINYRSVMDAVGYAQVRVLTIAPELRAEWIDWLTAYRDQELLGWIFTVLAKGKLFVCGWHDADPRILVTVTGYLFENGAISTTGMCPRCRCIQWSKPVPLVAPQESIS